MNDQEIKAYEEGEMAFEDGFTYTDNPYIAGSSLAHAWDKGMDNMFDAEFEEE